MNLNVFLTNPPFQSSSISALWKNIACLEDSFDKLNKTDKKKQLHLESTYLAIEFLRGSRSIEWFNKDPQQISRQFLSSGTTASTRSLSYFSHDGLLLFKTQSLKIFHDLMKRFFPEIELTIPGISLIPTVAEWPTSSLAQMIEWFGEFWHLDYISSEELSLKIKSLDPKKPIWFFATPFQLIKLFDHGFSQALPKGSIIFETGGTKGKSREISKRELYWLIEERFNIPQRSIISEYGMCELASQAYEFVNNENEERHFRFPSWVEISVATGVNSLLRQGIGALTIKDPLRIDYPYPLRTQDLVEIDSKGFFRILGRLPKAPLKGCSLLTEELITNTPPRNTVVPLSIHGHSSASDSRKKLKNENHKIDFSVILKALIEELGSKNAAKEAILDLQFVLPKSKHELETMIANSKAKSGDRWLFILPNNHSLAGFYPLYVAKFANLKVIVRLPKTFSQENSALQIFINTLHLENPSLFPSNFRISIPEFFPKDIDRVAIFGDDNTVKNIKEICPVPVKGFGSGITISLINSYSELNASLLAKDMLSLGQRGCMSTRALLAAGDWDEILKFIDQLRKACRKFWGEDLTLIQRLGIEQEMHRYKECAFIQAYQELNDPFFPIFNQKKRHVQPSEFLSPQPFVLPIFFYQDDHGKLLEDSNQFPSLVQISSCDFFKDKIKNISCARLGQANRPTWDGFHFQNSLFEVDDHKF